MDNDRKIPRATTLNEYRELFGLEALPVRSAQPDRPAHGSCVHDPAGLLEVCQKCSGERPSDEEIMKYESFVTHDLAEQAKMGKKCL